MSESAVSEAVLKKAAKYLAERRLNVVEADETGATVQVKGSGPTPYTVTFNGAWTCDCPAHTRCAHVEAASLVIHRADAKPKIPTPEPDDDLDALLGLK